MSTFKTCVRIVAAHRLYILIYLVLLSTFGLFTGMARSEDYSSQVTTATANVAVVDRDDSTISRGVKDYVESVGKVQPLEDSRQAIQDATAQNRINYILIIPAGYGQQLQEAVRQCTEPPRMGTVIGYESAAGSLMNVRTDSYLGQVADYLSTLTDDPARAVSLAISVESHVPLLVQANPLWQTARCFYGLLYYDSLEPFTRSCAVLLGMTCLFLTIALIRARRMTHEHL